MAILISLAIGSVAIKPEDSVNDLTFGPNVRVDDTGTDLSRQGFPSIAVNGTGIIYVAWHDDRTTLSNLFYDIFLARSTDGGKSFEANVRVDDGGINTRQYFPCVAVDNVGTVHVAWQDSRNGEWDIYYAQSTDEGLTFSVNGRVDDSGNDTSVQEFPSMAIDQSGTIYVAWSHWLSGNAQIRLARSIDGGASFEPSVRVDDPFPGASIADAPSVTAHASGNVYVSWSDNRNSSSHVYLSKSIDGGQSFGPDIQVDDATVKSRGSSSIKADAVGNIYAVWIDARNDKQDIYFAKSINGGLSFNKNIPVSYVDNDNIDQLYPSLAVDSIGTVYVAWTDKRDNLERNPFLAISTDGGAAFGEAIRVDDTGAAIADQPDSSLAIFEANNTTFVHLAWTDYRNGNLDVYYASSAMSHLRPDLAIEDNDIGFFPSSPTLGEFVSINASIRNVGDIEASNVSVRFFDGSPIPGNEIDADQFIIQLADQGTEVVGVTWNASTAGMHDICVVIDPDNMIVEYNESNNIACRPIEVDELIPKMIPPPSNLTANVVGEDIRLNWTAPENVTLSHYLVYRSESQMAFDFESPIHNTSGDLDPLATNWTDDEACSDIAPWEFYYIVRAVGIEGTMSTTSNTAGKWTVVFDSGVNSFSLPLEPYRDLNISWFAGDIPNVIFIRWMDSAGHWITHPKGMGEGVSDTIVRMGKGYEVALTSLTRYTFTGYPGSMIRFQGGLGDSLAFRKSLSVSIEGNDVDLSWDAISGANRYLVFRSDRRDGLHDSPLSPMANTTGTDWIDPGIIKNQTSEYYYMVIPLDSDGEMGSSTYSVGVTTVVYEGESDTFALPLRPIENHTLDWYSDAIPDVAGMAFMIFELWKYHAKEMPQGVYDVDVLQGEGYQISIDGPSSKFTFVGY